MEVTPSPGRAARKKRERIIKIITTVLLFYGNFAFGFLNFVVAPSIMDLMVIMKTSIETISLYFMVVRIGYTAGAFFGFLYNYLNRHLMAVLMLVMMGCCLAMIPQMSSPSYMFLCGSLIGIGMGGWDCALNVWLVELWQESAGPFLQTSSTLYTVGSILGPLIVNPFLTSKRGQSTNANQNASWSDTTEISINNSSDLTTLMPEAEPSGSERRAKLTIPFTISGAVVVIGGVMLLLLFFFKQKKRQQAMIDRRISIGSCLVDSKTIPPQMVFGWPAKLLTVLSSLLVASYFGLEITYLQLFPTFGYYSELHLSESSAAIILSAISAAEMVARFASIFIAMKLSPNTMLSINFVVINIGFFIVLFEIFS